MPGENIVDQVDVAFETYGEDDIETTIEARDILIDLVERELVGPKSPDEILFDSPQQRYIVGQLAPVQLMVDEEIDEDIDPLDQDVTSSALDDPALADEIDSGDNIARARSESLNSIGISFVVKPPADIFVEASWGQYESRPDGDGSAFARSQHEASTTITLDGACHLTKIAFGRVELAWVARRLGDHLIASVFMTNSQPSEAKDGTERLYQVELYLKGLDGSRPFLSRDRVLAGRNRSPEDLLYRNRREYGSGLHVAVREGNVDEAEGAAGTLETRVMPRAETRVTTARDFPDPDLLSMTRLGKMRSRVDAVRDLRSGFLEYQAWVENLADRSKGLSDNLAPVAEYQISQIAERLKRLNAGLNLLAEREDAFLAFRFANEAMARARFRQVHPRARLDERFEEAQDGHWRPFQLAFLISQLPEMVEPSLAERELVDVLFFPTGGGKTEAYLGLAAFAMAWRRFGANLPYHGAGVSILMRYTLRLLTTQQFSRAATLVSAAEIMRIARWEDGILGTVPFSIGLWVGPMTPSSFDLGKDALKDARRSHNLCGRNCELSKSEKEHAEKGTTEDSDSNFMVLTECPWCASPLCVQSVRLMPSPNRIEIVCENDACPCSPNGSASRIPIWFVDSDVYRECPTMIIATVDKFATLPYRGEAKSIFGNVIGFCVKCGLISDMIPHSKACREKAILGGRTGAFDLIIQDELHTITDNIGSVYGLYEGAIEFLAELGGTTPKYIAATATVKNVEKQIAQLYAGRASAVFPPVGLEAGDTFFSTDVAPSADRPGRTYVGIYAPTKSRLTNFVSSISSILASAWALAGRYGRSEADPYLTLLGYFNTIRDLGGVKSLLADDIPPVLERIANENGWEPRVLQDWEDELTGRIESGEVPQRLASLNTVFSDDKTACDFMACTNMISVGVDVPRLGLMIMDGQPKSTSEYIQATSRVGRASPGIVFIAYNAMRPRDVSHYEHFRFYHDSYYRFVEGGSVTPFSDGCVNRYLAGAYVAAYRLSDTESEDRAADRFKDDRSGVSSDLAAYISTRAAQFGDHERLTTTAALDGIVTKWSLYPEELRYSRPALPPMASKMMKAKIAAGPRPVVESPEERRANMNPDEGALFAAPRSMRNVETAVPLKVTNHGE
jgi:hypothetical protein